MFCSGHLYIIALFGNKTPMYYHKNDLKVYTGDDLIQDLPPALKALLGEGLSFSQIIEKSKNNSSYENRPKDLKSVIFTKVRDLRNRVYPVERVKPKVIKNESLVSNGSSLSSNSSENESIASVSTTKNPNSEISSAKSMENSVKILQRDQFRPRKQKKSVSFKLTNNPIDKNSKSYNKSKKNLMQQGSILGTLSDLLLGTNTNNQKVRRSKRVVKRPRRLIEEK